MPTYKKIKDKEDLYEKTDTKTSVTILDKKELEATKKFLEDEMAKLQKQLDFVNENLDGISKAK